MFIGIFWEGLDLDNKTKSITVLGFTVPSDCLDEIMQSDQNLPVQTHKFAWSLARALSLTGSNVNFLSAMPVSNYPKMPRLLFAGKKFQSEGYSGHFIGFVNLLVFKHLTRFFWCILYGVSYVKKNRTDLLVVHGVHSPFLLFAIFLKFFKIKIVAVLTDPPGVFLPTDGLFVMLLKRIDRLVVKALLSRFDGVIALTQALVDDFAPLESSFVMSGFLDPNLECVEFSRQVHASGVFKMAYAGGLSDAYGVNLLLEAVQKSNCASVQLFLYGKGELVTKIIEVSRQDSRIIYGGVVPPSDLPPLLSEFDLLVNPRPSSGSFVRHSFPSKIIEYMALNVPVLTTRLSGIPKNYFEHMYVVDDETASGLWKSIESVMNTPVQERGSVGLRARRFIIDEASESARASSMNIFIDKIFKGGSCNV